MVPVVFRRGRYPVAVVGLADQRGLDKFGEGGLDLREARIGRHGIVEAGGHILGRAPDALHELEKADRLGYRLRLGMVDLGWDRGDLGADIGRDVALDEVVDVVEADERADILGRKPCLRIDQELLGQLDDRAVGAADVPAGAALGAQARHDLDDQVDLVGQQRVEVDEGLSVDVRQPDVGLDARVLEKPAAVRFEQRAQGLLGAGILGQDAAAGDL